MTNIKSETERLLALYENSGNGSEWLYSEGGRTKEDEEFIAALEECAITIIRQYQKREAVLVEALEWYADFDYEYGSYARKALAQLEEK